MNKYRPGTSVRSGEPHDPRRLEFTDVEACRMYPIEVTIYRNADFVPLLITEFGRITAPGAMAGRF